MADAVVPLDPSELGDEAPGARPDDRHRGSARPVGSSPWRRWLDAVSSSHRAGVPF